ncbi:MAG: hypothetical protein L0K41_06320 [Yaniella sp.]|uniref:hypothetical protein n=1 Tax=Yaniella sp. TaxID=2773929 RepID=UPI00264722B0|nr:hypothetical protein [Yaniella sp.]MDN5703860.1 hypothetical protein [Yaniella sp.]MDN5732091.1 hypothetical protein [Yaniella sp.]MDN5741969.1 hypothetical protein [Yaniella sp.]MDN5815845.1 hypothetical protein [Yaniella sp.]MDN5818545.1 hypothetical protein [Yaniella sp.]
MTNSMWARDDIASDQELAELRFEISETMDDHEKTRQSRTDWRQRLFPKRLHSRRDSAVGLKMRKLRSHKHAEVSGPESALEDSGEEQYPTRQDDCTAGASRHHHEYSPEQFDTVEHSLNAIYDLAGYLEKSPRTIWIALEGIFTERQTSSAPTLFRHRIAILARMLPTALIAFLLAFVLLHFVMPGHQTDAGYTPIFSELGFLLFLTLFTTLTFFILTAVMLLIKSTLQERFLTGFGRLVNWSIPVTMSFFFASPEFLLLLQDISGGTSTSVAGIGDILQAHDGIVETIYWTVLVYVSIYAGLFFSFIGFSKVFQEQREYAHRHAVLRNVIPLLVSDSTSARSMKLFRVHR